MSVRSRRAPSFLAGVSWIALTAGGLAAPANAQSSLQVLSPVTVLATKTTEQVWDSLSAVSAVRPEQIQQLMPSKPSDLLYGVPGVSFQERADDPGTAVNIRGLQDFGRVAILIDGARQNFQRTGHNADGVFYLEPEMIGAVDVVRGPIANIYGTGAIGGVVSFNTKDVNDVLRPGQMWGILTRGEGGSNEAQGVGSTFAAARLGPNAEFIVGATYRSKSEYKDGDGNLIPNTDSETRSQLAKFTWRPMDGHQVKLSYLNFDTRYDTGQPYYGVSALPPPVGTLTGELSTIYGTRVNNQIATAGWTYSRPDDRLFDFDGKVYWTQTGTTQQKIDGIVPPPFALGNIGDVQSFEINTKGVDLHNSSRFDIGPFRQVLTIGGDGFRDEVDTNGVGQVFTPSGERTVSGAFVQLKSNYSTWLEVVGAARYDNYELQGGGFKSSGDRVSPKITVGVTPYQGITPYVTYAEGYRAPAITETLVAGLHPIFFAPFQFIPNTGLQPEIGKTEEVGVNFRFDNVFMQGDTFRAKVNAYRNNVTNYIDIEELTFGQVAQGGLTCTHASFLPFGPPPGVPVDPDCVQYQNVAHARLEGYEAETLYDAGTWFAGINYSHVKGHNADTGESLAKIAPDSVTTTLGTRLLNKKLTIAVRWKQVDAKHSSDIPQNDNGVLTYPSTGSYNLVNLYVGYEPTPDILASLSVENLLDEQYAPYLSVYPDPASSQSVPIGFPQPGITIKGAIRVLFSDELLRKGWIRG